MGKPMGGWQSLIIKGQEVEKWLSKKIVFGMCYGGGADPDYLEALANTGSSYYSHLYNRIAHSNGFYIEIQFSTTSTRQGYGVLNLGREYYYGTRPNGRIIGVVKNKNDDGSLEIELLGNNEQIDLNTFKRDTLQAYVQVPLYYYDDVIQGMPDILTWVNTTTGNGAKYAHNGIYFPNGYDIQVDFDTEESLGFEPHTFFNWHCTQNGVLINNQYPILNITTSQDTVVVGVHANTRSQFLVDKPNYNLGLIDNALQGDIFDLLLKTYWNTVYMYNNQKFEDLPNENLWFYGVDSELVKLFSYAQYYKLFNVPLTYSRQQALQYIETGVLPNDVFLYPFDLDNLSSTDGEPPSGGTTPPSGEDGDDGIEGEPTADADPVITPNMLNNNNYYWLQAGQLESFIRWFWNDAGEILDVGDLWKYLQGLYNDLGQAIINIRYFPVDPQYIGGTSDTSDIIIANIKMPMSNVKTLQRRKLTKRTLGTIDISQRYNAFTDFSPYTELMLYLPFHGWITLDVDLFMKNKCRVKCIYDHVSGTIQYGVYVVQGDGEFLVNTCIAKMAVDIPITLQSKIERDSAIFQNVTNAFGSLVGGGASIATGNPIGLVMATSNVVGGGSMSAPFKINGSVGESGSFFMPNKCCIYIKRPSYNRPSGYAEHVGFPSNQSGKLSKFKGYTTVYNPQITFSGNDNNDGVVMKPLESEVQEIYDLLQKGVIL